MRFDEDGNSMRLDEIIWPPDSWAWTWFKVVYGVMSTALLSFFVYHSFFVNPEPLPT